MKRTRRLPATLVACLLAAIPSLASEPLFREVSASWGAVFRHHHGGSGKRLMPETDGSGVVLFDYDGDGDLDLLFIDGGSLPGYRGEPPRSVLFRNEAGRRFVDLTERSRLEIDVYGMGGAAGDIDNDGDLDLYVTAFGPNKLFRNDGDGTFSDRTLESGAAESRWSSSAAFADFDRDGWLDLYVTNYVAFPLDPPTLCFNEQNRLGAYCHPDLFAGEPDRLLRNRGDGTFADVTAAAGLGGASGKGLGVVAADLDDDGFTDLYVANDTTPNFLFRNRGDGTFEDRSLLSGTSYSDTGSSEAGMGIALGDIDGDGRPDLLVTNYALESNALYRNLGAGLFADARHASGIVQPSLVKLGFGTAFADFDLDGDLDLVVANGHVLDNVEEMNLRRDLTYRQPNQLLENLGDGRFEERQSSGLDVVRASRGLATGDLDLDGDLDLVITNSNDLAEVYETVGSPTRHWLQVVLDERPGANRFGIGARVAVTAGGRQQHREVVSSGSYLSQSDTALTFGLGGADSVERLEVRWTDGEVRVLTRLPADRRVRVRR